MRFTLVLLAALLIVSLAGCGANQEAQLENDQGASPESAKEPTAQETTQDQLEATSAAAPVYEVTLDEEGEQMRIRFRNVSATPDATSREELEAIIRELRDSGPAVDAIILTFYPNAPTADPVGTGEAYRDEEATRTFISAQYTDPSEADVESQVHEVMANDAFRVISYEELETTGYRLSSGEGPGLCGLPRTSLLGTRVDKGKKEAEALSRFGLLGRSSLTLTASVP